ncbi:MAG: glycosyltransferase family 2 protein [Haloarculaceae archaeon]
MPVVSVVIPTYNRADVLSRAVESALAQTLADVEVIVVDDASTDHTDEVLASFDDDRLTTLVHDENRGGSAARNTGIDHATGEYVAFLDSDDEWRPTKLERQVSTLERRSDEWVAAYCGVEFVTGSDPGPISSLARSLFSRFRVTEGAEGGEELVADVLTDDLHTSAGSTLLVCADVVDDVGGFDESFPRFQDSEFLIRVLQRGKLAYVDAPLLRRHDTGNPDADALRRADAHYLRAFAETVQRLEAAGHDVTGAHHYMLGKAYVAEGRFRTGLRYLLTGRPPGARQCPGLLRAACRGAARRFD